MCCPCFFGKNPSQGYQSGVLPIDSSPSSERKTHQKASQAIADQRLAIHIKKHGLTKNHKPSFAVVRLPPAPTERSSEPSISRGDEPDLHSEPIPTGPKKSQKAEPITITAINLIYQRRESVIIKV